MASKVALPPVEESSLSWARLVRNRRSEKGASVAWTVNKMSVVEGRLRGSLKVPKSKLTLLSVEFVVTVGVMPEMPKKVSDGPKCACPTGGGVALTAALNVTEPIGNTGRGAKSAIW